jgi:hypothetical protein
MSIDGLQTPHSLEDGTLSVMRHIGLPADDQDHRRKIATFIRCNGYMPVWRAANFTRDRQEHHTVRDPWKYTISVFNTNLVLLERLYPLTHWVEMGLRSQLDLAYCTKRGANWYRFPERYLPHTSVTNFVKDASMPDIFWEDTTIGIAHQMIREMESSGAFLEAVTFGWLVAMVQYCHEQDKHSILVRPGGRLLLTSEVERLLKPAKEARNDVAHNRFIDINKFRYYDKYLLELLDILHFDVDRAKTRLQAQREWIGRQLERPTQSKATAAPPGGT